MLEEAVHDESDLALQWCEVLILQRGAVPDNETAATAMPVLETCVALQRFPVVVRKDRRGEQRPRYASPERNQRLTAGDQGLAQGPQEKAARTDLPVDLPERARHRRRC